MPTEPQMLAANALVACEECESCVGEHGVEKEANELRIAWNMLFEDNLKF
jgi:hypothetical protein